MGKMILDGILIAFSFILAYYVRFKIFILFSPQFVPLINKYGGTLLFIVIIWLAIFKLFGLYERRRENLFDQLGALLGAVTLSSLLLYSLLFMYKSFWFSRLVVFYGGLIALSLLALGRIAVYLARKFLHSKKIGLKKLIIVGAGDTGQALAKKLTEQNTGYSVVGFVDDDPGKLGLDIAGVPVLGDTTAIRELLVRLAVCELVFATSKIPPRRLLDIITECESLHIEFKLVPGILELLASRVDVGEMGGIPLVTISETGLRGYKAGLKRLFDIFLSFAFIALFFWLPLITALIIKFVSPGPIFYTQKRAGKNGQEFDCYKFRTMKEEAIIGNDIIINKNNIHDFPVVPGFGSFLRRTHLDELPQVFNVLKGEMSMVGPRPPLPRELAQYSAWHKKRLRVAPGVTGLWQVYGDDEYKFNFDKIVELDIYYIENWSLWLDIKILLLTIPEVLLGRGK